jgi:hypothetical protein
MATVTVILPLIAESILMEELEDTALRMEEDTVLRMEEDTVLVMEADMAVTEDSLMAVTVVHTEVMVVVMAVMAADMEDMADMEVVMDDMVTVIAIPSKWDHLVLSKTCSMMDTIK